MANLHLVVESTRKLLLWMVMGLAGIIFLVVVYRFASALFLYFYPPKAPPPAVAFGKLPAIPFPQSVTTLRPTYTIDTISGTLPVFPDRATVYKIQQFEPDLVALQNVETVVSQLPEFQVTPTPITDSVYAWQSQQVDPQKTVTIDILSHDYTLTSNYLSDPAITTSTNFVTGSDGVNAANDFMGTLFSLPSDIDQNKTQSSLFTIANGGLIPATTAATTQVARIDYFQSDINKLPIYYANPPHSTINTTIAATNQGPQVVAAQVVHKNILRDQNTTYPLKSADQALKDLQNGDAYIASYNGTETAVTIKNITLGYYAADQTQQYLLPVVVFQGDNGFYAYVSAVTDAWISK